MREVNVLIGPATPSTCNPANHPFVEWEWDPALPPQQENITDGSWSVPFIVGIPIQGPRARLGLNIASGCEVEVLAVYLRTE